MRLDITLYVLAIVFFMIALLSVVLLEGTKQSLWVITTGLLGTLSLGLGFVQRPKTAKMVNPSQTATIEVPAPPAAVTTQPTETLPPPPPAPEMTPTAVAQPIETSQPAPETSAVTITQQIENVQPQEQQLPAVQAPALETPAVPEKVVAVEMKVAEPVNTAVPQQVAEVTVESPLMRVSGIGEKRAAQLNALGINTLDDLANASTKDIAKSLKVSPKIVAKWIAGAKQLNKK